MFENKLKDTLKEIFEVKKVSLDMPSDKPEQDTLFVQIESSNNRIKDGEAIARVSGSAFIYAKSSKLPFGYFSKKIQEAKPALTKDLFFFDVDANGPIYQDLVERSFSFVYFFDGQYNPIKGNINDIDLDVEIGG